MVVDLEQPVSMGADEAGGAPVAAPTIVKVTLVVPTFGTAGTAFDVHVTSAGAEATTYTGLTPAQTADGALATVLDATRQQLRITPEPGSRDAGDRFHLFSSDKGLDASVSRKLPAWLAAGAEVKKAGSARAPMPSRVVQVMVEVGQSVRQGDPLVMVEAMKTVSQTQLGRAVYESAKGLELIIGLGCRLAGARVARAEGRRGERGEG